MRKKLTRLLAGLLTVLALCVHAPLTGAAPPENAPVLQAFSFARAGTTAEQARSYRIAETARGRFAWIALYYTNIIVLPVTDADMEAFSVLIAEMKLAEWNGFEETDPSALDGESFSLNAAFSDGGVLSARGMNRFPEKYWETAARVEAFFRALMESYEIDVEHAI